ncbi:unnamed protein product [Gongylonema pulchrum]|uniref:Helicase C-terminal domain-containing protein n=1 Tax=Gongylonema pulchrum TaxID=637853 RepID=A0A183E006_9BILA|nr:unnamed protein product [Gongylonema pulchrum]
MMRDLDEICYEKVHYFVRGRHQVLVFVTARNATTKLAMTFRDEAAKKGELDDFLPVSMGSVQYTNAAKTVQSCRNSLLSELFRFGFGIHHAGLPRRERLVVEKLFANGHISVLFCTSTLAWGINLPAHAVVIRGTEIFDAQKGAFTDIGVLDVQQIFGRAGRPQYESSGSVSSIAEAVEWLKYTYFYIRAKLNPLSYGISRKDLADDPNLDEYLAKLVTGAATKLDLSQMIRFDSLNGYMSSTDLGRIASNFYVKYETVDVFMNGLQGQKLEEFMTDDMILSLIASAKEFNQIKVREEETEELEQLAATSCPLRLKMGALSTVPGKINCLMQAYISRAFIRSYSLLSESMFIQQNSSRLCRAMFEVTLRRGWAQAANATLAMAKCLDRKVWQFQTPLRYRFYAFCAV